MPGTRGRNAAGRHHAGGRTFGELASPPPGRALVANALRRPTRMVVISGSPGAVPPPPG